MRKKAKEIIKSLKGINPQGRTLLDIGSGRGFLLAEAKKFGLNPIGIEPSKQLSSFSAKNLKLKVFNLSLAAFYKMHKKQKFDFIVVSHVIEHILNPRMFLKKASRLLNKDGCLYVETPNLDSWLFWAERATYTFLTPPDHIWIFSQKSFKNLLMVDDRLWIRKIQTYSYSEHLMGIAKRIIKGRIVTKPERAKMEVRIIDNDSPEQEKRIGGKIKFFLFDKLVAHLFLPLINIADKGSILQIYLLRQGG
ncbi:MAG: class I SAM-dependent methyltransferase [FCB group bacterium]|nr:class I SAM-dependent methyltransferase [FCB group bacterium]